MLSREGQTGRSVCQSYIAEGSSRLRARWASARGYPNSSRTHKSRTGEGERPRKAHERDQLLYADVQPRTYGSTVLGRGLPATTVRLPATTIPPPNTTADLRQAGFGRASCRGHRRRSATIGADLRVEPTRSMRSRAHFRLRLMAATHRGLTSGKHLLELEPSLRPRHLTSSHAHLSAAFEHSARVLANSGCTSLAGSSSLTSSCGDGARRLKLESAGSAFAALLRWSRTRG